MRDNHSAAEKIKEISGTNPLKCMKCGKCSATCPSFDEMDIKPHQFVSYVINENIEALVNSASLWKCLSCFACVERCPRDVKPGKIIGEMSKCTVGFSHSVHIFFTFESTTLFIIRIHNLSGQFISH